MEHIHLLVSTFDTSNVAVAHNLRSCSRVKTTLRDQDRDQDQGGQDQDQDQDLKKVVLIGLETKTKSRDPHPCILQDQYEAKNSDDVANSIDR